MHGEKLLTQLSPDYRPRLANRRHTHHVPGRFVRILTGIIRRIAPESYAAGHRNFFLSGAEYSSDGECCVAWDITESL